MRGAVMEPIADLEGIYGLNHGVAEFVVGGRVDVDAFQAQADSARVHECECSNPSRPVSGCEEYCG